MSIKDDKNPSDAEFEISFYERILQERPNFIEALMALGDLYTKSGRYEEGLKLDEHLSRLRPEDPLVHYNLACSYSLLKETDKALATIKKAVACGYSDFDYLLQDKDLSQLRECEKFKEFFAGIKPKP